MQEENEGRLNSRKSYKAGYKESTYPR